MPNLTPTPTNPFGGAQVAAYLGAQSVLQRLSAGVPGRWRQEFRLLDPPPGARRLYMTCCPIVTLPITDGGPEVEGLYEDVGEMDSGSRAGLARSSPDLVAPARVVKIANSLGAGGLASDPSQGDGQRLLFLSGEDADAKSAVRGLFADARFLRCRSRRSREGRQMQQFVGPLAGLDLIRLP